MNSLMTAQLAIYAVLILPVTFIFFRHLWTGLIAWFYLLAFCSLRIIGGALSLSSSASSTASIISSVGLSPLLLATAGILHESCVYRANDILKKKIEWTMVVIYHVFVASGIGLLAAGASALSSHTATATTATLMSDQNLVIVGAAILTACWAILVLWALVSLRPMSQDRQSPQYQTGALLFHTVLAALPFLGIRVIYSLIALTSRKGYLNPVSGALDIRVLLSFLPEVIITLLYVFVGLRTRCVRETRKLRNSLA